MTSRQAIDSLVRIKDRDAPLGAIVARAQKRSLPVTLAVASPAAGEDYAQIDESLAVEAAGNPPHPFDEPPAPGLSYAGFTPRQRRAFLDWQHAPGEAAPRAFQQLYLASLEVRLLEGNPMTLAARSRIEQIEQGTAWRDNLDLWRVSLLSQWLKQDGGKLAQWLAASSLPAELVGTALGMQAMLRTPLDAAEERAICSKWGLPAADLSEAVLTFRLQSLAAAIGAEPLQWAFAQLGDVAMEPRPWRCQHRELRIHLPQPDVRRTLEPLLAELAVIQSTDAEDTEEPDRDDTGDAQPKSEMERAHIIVEFRHSRSEYFAFALKQAQRRAGFMQLLDEDRHLVYRVPFRKNEMNHFWQLWNYVQGWTATRVYCKGQELQKWQIYPYSQYLR